MARHHLMTSVKNEAVYLIEWIAHHKALGFDQIYVAANNCSDGTIVLLRRLQKHNFIEFSRNKCPADKIPQHEGYKTLREKFDVDKCDWLMTLDVDEFLHVEAGNGSVGALTDIAGDDVDIIALNSLTYGTGLSRKRNELVTKRFQHRLRDQHTANRPIKSIARNPARFHGAHNHHLTRVTPDAELTVMRADGSTFVIPPKTELWRVLRSSPADHIVHEYAHYNHYSIKSRSEYTMRQQRGRGAVPVTSTEKQRHSGDYFRKRASADVLDTRIDKYADKVKMWMDDMLSFPDILEKQEEAEEKFFAKISEIRDTSDL